jgi:uncharacterized membrane protein
MGYSELWPVHAIFMGTSFALMLTGTLLSMFNRKKKWRIKVHKNLNMTGSIAGIVALGIAVYMIQVSFGAHFSVIHSIIGLITLMLIVITPIMGMGILKVKSVENKKKLQAIHPWIGRITLVLMAVTIILGLRLVGIL